MVNFDETSARWNRITDHSINTEQVKSDSDADDVNNRIDRPNFVEVNLFDRRTVNASFGFSHSQKHLQSQLSLARRQRGSLFDNPADVRVMAVSMLFRMINENMQRSKAAFDDGLDTDDHIREIQRSNCRANFIGIGSCIDQGREGHVSTETCGAFKPGDSHEYSSQKMQKQISRKSDTENAPEFCSGAF